jgi:hypothetical protein
VLRYSTDVSVLKFSKSVSVLRYSKKNIMVEIQ